MLGGVPRADLRYHRAVAENNRPPVAIRIVRPYESEDELLEHELETVGKTSVVLIGAHPRPTGVILRFEVTLASGTTVLRGEGRVLAHKENAFRGQPGLTLRFTRLDPRSKSVVDRATAMRESRSMGDVSSPSRPVLTAPVAEGPLADALTASTPAPGPTSEAALSMADQEAAVASTRAAAREKANATARANAKRTGSGRAMALTPPPVPASVPVMAAPPIIEAPVEAAEEDAPAVHEVHEVHEVEEQVSTPAPTPVTSVPGEVSERPRPIAAPPAPAPAAMRASAPSSATPSSSGRARGPVDAPPDRADLLARLRERAGKLAPERVEAILSARR
jgi:ribonuclease E